MPTKRKSIKQQQKQENTTARSGVSQKRVLKHTKPSSAGKSSAKKSTKSRQPLFPKPLRIFIGVVVAALIVGLLYLSWNQWLRYDDAKDFQGEWVAQGTNEVVTITDSKIIFDANTSYSYSLDTYEKTISFSFNELKGSGTYAFSEERDTLVIVERGEKSGTSVTTFVRVGSIASTPEAEASSGVESVAAEAESTSSDVGEDESSGVGESEEETEDEE